MGTLFDFGNFGSAAAATGTSKIVTRFLFLFAIGLYLLTQFLGQLMEFKGENKEAGVLTVLSGAMVGITSAGDMFYGAGNPTTRIDEEVEGILVGIYAVLVVVLGAYRYKSAGKSQPAASMTSADILGILAAYTSMFILVIVAMYTLPALPGRG